MNKLHRLAAAAAGLMLGLAVSLGAVFAQDWSVPLGFDESNAKGMILMEGETGRILFGVNPDKKLPMASTTKIMTALLTLEQPSLDASFVVNAAAIRVEGTSMGLREGDSVSLRTLAAGMLLASGNDAANAAAVAIDGSTEKFAQRMNERAAQIGMENTSFVTPSGLDDENHYSTARDMGLLAREALRNPEFAALCSSSTMKLYYGNPPYARWLSNHNRLLREYEGTIGVKTGFTKKSGRCLVSAAKREDVPLICVTLGASDDWNLHKQALNAGFAALKRYSISDLLTEKYSVPVTGGTESSVRIVPQEEIRLSLTEEEAARLEIAAQFSTLEYAPVARGQLLGEITVLLDGKILEAVPLAAEREIAAKPKNNNGIFSRLFGSAGK